MTAIHALGIRGDASAIPELQALLNANDLSIEMAPEVKEVIAQLKEGSRKQGPRAGRRRASWRECGSEREQRGRGIARRLDKLEHLVEEMNERLKTIEKRLPEK